VSASLTSRPRIIIIRAGFGGLAAARALGGKPVDVTLLDRTNHHLFQPLLYQVAAAGLSPANIAQPVRSILRGKQNIKVLMTEVTGIHAAAKVVKTAESELPFEYLIVATEARHSYFGHPGWEPFAPDLKSLDDALDIRRRLLLASEKAEVTTEPVERSRLLTFVVVGAGPTGVEMAGAISEIARETMTSDFRNIDPGEAQVILLDASDRVLPVFDPKLSKCAESHLRNLKVTVRLGVSVRGIDAESVTTAKGVIPGRHAGSRRPHSGHASATSAGSPECFCHR
jgi:NADH dehydrogenase